MPQGFARRGKKAEWQKHKLAPHIINSARNLRQKIP